MSLIISVLLGSFLSAYAYEDSPLDPTVPAIHPVQVNEQDFFPKNPLEFRPLYASDLRALVSRQTPVKSQIMRGTCSIFSALGIVESLYKIHTEKEMDLSENYLEYLVMSRMKQIAQEGSDIPLNIPAIAYYGMIEENVWPYEGYDWMKPSLPIEEKLASDKMCGSFDGNRRQACLISHLDPMNDPYVENAKAFAQSHGTNRFRYGVLTQQGQIQWFLNNNLPVVLSIEFFYGAWNHRMMETYAIGTRNMDMWSKGIVSFPQANDIQISRQHPAGHSIVIVGYDDSRRVYYFKNSWGTQGFGDQSDLLGAGTTAGYGAISYDYAHNFGSFYQVVY